MKLEAFNKKYKYKSDSERFNTFFDVWELPKDTDLIEADCESYCRFLRNYVEGFDSWEYYYCKLNGIGHCVLYKDGNIIDCNIRKIVSYDKYCSIFNVSEFKKYNWFVILSKITFAKIYTIFNKGS